MPVHHGGHRSGGVLGVFLAKPLVPGTPAGAGGGAWPVELPDPARHDGDRRSQVSLGLWTSMRFAPDAPLAPRPPSRATTTSARCSTAVRPPPSTGCSS